MRSILAVNPDDHQVRAALGDLLAATGNTSAAETEYRYIRDQAPKIPAGYLKLGQLYWQTNRRGEAVAQLENGYRAMPASMPLFTNLVRLYLAEKKGDAAVNLCEEAIARHPDSAFAYNALGSVLVVKKDYPGATKAFSRAIEIQPLWQVPHNGLARAYLLQGKTAEAIARLETATQSDPKNPAAFLTLGNIYERQGDDAKARATYEKALEANPEMWPAANNLAFLLAETDNVTVSQLDQATVMALKAMNQQPENPVVLDTLGWIYYRRGNIPLALSYVEQAVSRTGDSPILNYHLAAVLDASGRTLEARAALEKALNTNEDFHGRDDAKALLEKLKREAKKGQAES
jgi:tetratricopeptide (TPR) repeat protein